MRAALRADDGEDEPERGGLCDTDIATRLSFLKQVSWITGLFVLQGGDPEKKGGDEDNWDIDCIATRLSCLSTIH